MKGDIPKEKKIKYVAMQYPTLDVDNIKNMFESNEDIIFISNERNLKKVLDNELWGNIIGILGPYF